jgi:hypothetical protein
VATDGAAWDVLPPDARRIFRAAPRRCA